MAKNPPANAREVRDMSLIPGSGRYPGGRHGNPLQYLCLEDTGWTEDPGEPWFRGSQSVGHD